MKVLVVTNMYPTLEKPAFGTFVQGQVEGLRRAGIKVDVLFIDGRKSRWNYFRGVFHLWAKLMKKRYHLIHAHYAISGLVARLQFLAPVVVTYHGAEVQDHAPAWLRFLARQGSRIFNQVIVVSRKEKKLIKRNHKVRVIPCGIDLKMFKPAPSAEARRRLRLPMDKDLILWAGEYWQPEKRFWLAKESVEILQKTRPNAELVLVSGRPLLEIPAYLNACNVLVLTSWSEGSPMVIKEAMACNLPIVSTDVGDVAEVMAGVEGCFLAEPTAQDVADKLLRVLRWGQRTQGREHILPLGSGPISRRIIGVYKEVCRAEYGLPRGRPLNSQ